MKLIISGKDLKETVNKMVPGMVAVSEMIPILYSLVSIPLCISLLNKIAMTCINNSILQSTDV
jgi:hypothetical protein